jgi:hypothetical protein
VDDPKFDALVGRLAIAGASRRSVVRRLGQPDPGCFGRYGCVPGGCVQGWQRRPRPVLRHGVWNRHAASRRMHERDCPWSGTMRYPRSRRAARAPAASRGSSAPRDVVAHRVISRACARWRTSVVSCRTPGAGSSTVATPVGSALRAIRSATDARPRRTGRRAGVRPPAGRVPAACACQRKASAGATLPDPTPRSRRRHWSPRGARPAGCRRCSQLSGPGL